MITLEEKLEAKAFYSFVSYKRFLIYHNYFKTPLTTSFEILENWHY